MNAMKTLQGPCTHCGRTVRYPAHLVGTMGKCPGCGQMTELVLETPEIAEARISRRTLMWTAITILILVVGLIAAVIALNKARTLRPVNPPPNTAKVNNAAWN